MSIRISALYILVAGLSIYAWKDWFKSLCGLILLMAVMEHRDMPRSMFGIQGFNPWNVLFVAIFLAWLVNRRREGLTWDMPRYVSVLLLLYLGVIVAGLIRTVFDRTYIEDYAIKHLISDQLVNTVKWVLPGLLLFDGCRTRKRVVTALVCILAMYFLIAVQVVRGLPASSVLHAGSNINETRRACSDIGYSACDMSTMLAGASWGIVAALSLIHKKKYGLTVLAIAGMVAFGQALTGGRAGYLAWGATGLALCFLKWRKLLILAPVVVVLLPIIFPGAAERMLEGFGQTDVSGETVIDDLSVTSGRTVVWPQVIDKIGESPMVGYGRLATKRTGLSHQVTLELGHAKELFSHPHNIYLETLLDNGILGSLPIFLFWATMVVYAARLFRDNNGLYSAVGGVALALMLAQLFAGIGSQHFYPEQSTLGVWAAMFLSLRVYVEHKRTQVKLGFAEDSWHSRVFEPQGHVAAASAQG
jgi:O-antigen ligase